MAEARVLMHPHAHRPRVQQGELRGARPRVVANLDRVRRDRLTAARLEEEERVEQANRQMLLELVEQSVSAAFAKMPRERNTDLAGKLITLAIRTRLEFTEGTGEKTHG